MLAALLPVASSGSAHALTNCATDDSSIDAEEANFLAIINDYRAKNGLATLSLSPGLNRSAAWMVNDMATRGYFGHTDSLGRGPWARMADCGYPLAGGENLAAGAYRDTGGAAFELFRNSPSHNENMLVPEYRQIGIARVFVDGSRYGWYWATTFGTTGDAPPPPPPPTPAPPPPTPPSAPPPAFAPRAAAVATPPVPPAAETQRQDLSTAAAAGPAAAESLDSQGSVAAAPASEPEPVSTGSATLRAGVDLAARLVRLVLGRRIHPATVQPRWRLETAALADVACAHLSHGRRFPTCRAGLNRRD